MITSIEEFIDYFMEHEACSERDFNKECLEMLRDGRLSEEVFLEYLEITQVDVYDCLANFN